MSGATGKLDISNRMDDGFRIADPQVDPLAPGAECLLVNRGEDEILERFVERCRKKLRKAKDEAAQAMVLALLVSDACGRSGVHAADLEARHAELTSSQRRASGELLLGGLLGDVASSPARNSRRTGAALGPERAILFKAVADWLGTFGCTLQRQQHALHNVVSISQTPCVVDLLFDPGALYEDPSPRAQELLADNHLNVSLDVFGIRSGVIAGSRCRVASNGIEAQAQSMCNGALRLATTSSPNMYRPKADVDLNSVQHGWNRQQRS